MDFIVIAMMAAALILFAYDKWWLSADKDIFAPPANSIAVLAFANMSPDPEQEFFSDGVSEELLNLLAQVPELKVIARTSSFSFKGEKADIATIAEKLNVRHVVEGSVRRSGDKVRITAQLIDTKDSTHVWSQTYDRELTEIIAVQDAIGKSIVEALKLRLPIDGVTLPKRVPRAASFEAYEVYLLGRHYLNQRGSDEAGRENIKAAIENFQKAIELDPGLAAAYADQALAVLSLSAFFVHNTPSEEAVARARLLVDRAAALAPDTWEVLAARGSMEALSGNYELAMEYYDQSLAINPSNGEVHRRRLRLLGPLGRENEMADALDEMLKHDPQNWLVLASYARSARWYGRLDEMLPVVQRLHAMTGAGHLSLAEYHSLAGNLDEATRYYLETLERNPGWLTDEDWQEVPDGFFRVLAMLGLREEALLVQLPDDLETHVLLGGLDAGLSFAREQYRKNPDSRRAVAALLGMISLDSDEEGADLALALWQMYGEDETQIRWMTLLNMAFFAQATGMEDLANRWSVAAHRGREAWLQRGYRLPGIHIGAAVLADFDGRQEEAIDEITAAIDEGYRARVWLDEENWTVGGPRFDAQRKRLDDILAEQRAEVVEMLCGPEPVSSTWEPAPETCALLP
jgi:TolB-like protein